MNWRLQPLLLLSVLVRSEDIIQQLADRFDTTIREVAPVVFALEDRNLLDRWLEVVHNPRPGLIVVDMQNDFISGSLSVEGAEDIIPHVKEIVQDPIWERVVFTQDWHPANHISFHSNWRLRPLDPEWVAAHISRGSNVSLFEEVVFARDPPYPQVLWPDHCVQGTKGAEIHPRLPVPSTALVVRKGTNPEVDSYSAFFDNSGTGDGDTGLAAILKGVVSEVVVVGLATDYCVASTAIDAQKVGLPSTLLEDLSRGVSPRTTAVMLERVGQAGGRVTSWDSWRVGLVGWDRAKQLADSLLSFHSMAPPPAAALHHLMLPAVLLVLAIS